MKDEKIPIPTGYEFSHVEGDEIVLKQTRAKVRRWEEQGVLEGVFIRGNCCVVHCKSNDRDVRMQNTFHTEDQAKAAIALAKLTQSLADLQQEPIVWDGVYNYYCICVSADNNGERLVVENWWSWPHFLAFRNKETATEFLQVHCDDIEAAAPLLWA